jgi:hypothetical protein
MDTKPLTAIETVLLISASTGVSQAQTQKVLDGLASIVSKPDLPGIRVRKLGSFTWDSKTVTFRPVK